MYMCDGRAGGCRFNGSLGDLSRRHREVRMFVRGFASARDGTGYERLEIHIASIGN
jgi:hypothetical protein